ncbi:MAG: hypothetical protein WC208_14960 [Gallionella sp.]
MDKIEESVNDILDISPDVNEPPVAPAEPTNAEPPAIADPPASPTPEPPVEPPPAPAAPPPTPSAVEPSATPATPLAEPPIVPAADPRDATIAELQATIAALQQTVGQIAGTAVAPAQSVAPEVKLDANGQPIAPEPPQYKFLQKEEELDQALNSVDNFNKMLSGVVNKAQESVLLMVPQLVTKMADEVVVRRMAAAEFFRANPDLAAVDPTTQRPLYRAFVGLVANEIAAAHPDWNMEAVMSNLGTEVRNRLRLSGGVPPGTPSVATPAAPVDPAAPTPAFVGPGGSRPSNVAPTFKGLEKDVLDLITD